MTTFTDTIEQNIREERKRQNLKFGVQNHDPMTFMCILTEEVGEAAQAANDARFAKTKFAEQTNLIAFREELVQVAAVAKQMIECLDREEWAWPFKTATKKELVCSQPKIS